MRLVAALRSVRPGRALVLAALFLSGAGAAGAVPILTGQTIRTDFLFPDTATVTDTEDSVVGPGVEIPAFPAFFPASSIDFEESAIVITLLTTATASGGSFNGWRFSDLNGTIDDLSSVSIDPSSTFTPLSVSADADTIFVNASAVSYSTGQFLRLVFVPEPAALALAAGALAAAAARRLTPASTRAAPRRP
jgi:hypothetical protein